ncbi:MAG TPA: 3-deoxy-manno-octulosonate cytidylyltransferase [Cyclobacteriaceae bacterium]|nr:3-deoxy-manno-octulosonate cytidylyltransferase [Cyclobacteriaceae bacterium]
MKKILAIIPARYASTRFPGKPLADIGGKSMIQRVYEQVQKAAHIDQIAVATDHQEIYDHVLAFGGNACFTSENHPTGTDRCYEALTLQNEKFDYVINIQGDEPFIQPGQMDQLTSLLDGDTAIATLVKKIETEEELNNPGEVKVVVNKNHFALYFSRAVIPHLRNVPRENWLRQFNYYKHIGLYAFRSDVLKEITTLPVSSLERAESLEQLRWLENGYGIAVAETHVESICIDTPEDIFRALEYLKHTV